MRLQPPAGGGRVGDGAVDERVAEAEGAAAGGARGRPRPARRAPPARPARRPSAAAVATSRSNGSPATAAPSASRRAAAGEAVELLRDRRRDRARHRLVGVAGAAAAARQLAQEERVAVGLVQDPLAHVVVELGAAAAPGRVLRLSGAGAARPSRRHGGRRRRSRGSTVPAAARTAAGTAARRPAQQVQQQLDRRLVGPLHVVEQQRQRPLGGDRLQLRPQRMVEAEALPRDHRLAGRRHRQRLEPVAERVAQQSERQLLPLLGGACARAPANRRRAPLGGDGEQRALADPGLAGEGEQPPAAGLRFRERACDRGDLDVAPKQSHRAEG